MKLFKSLLIAPATLGLLTPMSATANELNLAEVSGYSSSEEVQNISEFYPKELAVTNGRVDGLEARLNVVEAGSFSETTTMSGSAGFLLSAGDVPTGNSEATQLEYQVGISLDTSFTGEDNLNIGIESGNAPGTANTPGAILDWGVGNGDVLKVSDLNYTFPLAGWTVAVGDSMDASATWSSACAVSNTVDALGDCGAGNSTAVGGDVSISASTSFGDGFELGLGLSSNDGSTTQGIFTSESDDYYGISLSYLKDTYGFTVAYSGTTSTDITAGASATAYDVGDPKTEKTYLGFVGSFTPDSFPLTLSGGYEIGTVENDDDTYQYTLGASYPVGEGTLSVTGGTNGSFVGSASDMSDEEEVRAYDVSYSYPINDSTTIVPFAYTIPGADSDADVKGFGTSVSFSF